MKLRNKDITDLAVGLKALDNDDKNGYKFRGVVRLAIAKKLRRVSELAQDLEKTRQKMVRDAGIGKTRTNSAGDRVGDDDPLAIQKFNLEYAELMDAEVEVEMGALLEADLDFETNQIPGSIIAALLPIITLKAEPAS